MKALLFFVILSFGVRAFAGEVVHTAGEAQTTAPATLAALKAHFQETMPQVQGDAFVDGALNFNKGAREYNQFWEKRFKDDFDQPDEYRKAFADGKALWEKPFSDGKGFADCFPEGGHGAAAGYPEVDGNGEVVTFERALNACLEAHHEKPLAYDDMKTMGVLSLYARQLSDGTRIHVKVSTKAEEAAFDRGKTLYYTRMGQLSMSCASCHTQQAGRTLRSEELSPVIGQVAHFPVFRPNRETATLSVVTLQVRYQGCQKNVKVAQPFALNSTELNDLEYFHTYLSNGLPLHSGAFRK
jgi:sulfur-oxidizing protein SoxA